MRNGLIYVLITVLTIAIFSCKDENPAEPDPMAEANAYLTENAKKDSVSVTISGLQYEILVEGEGAKPTVTDTVKVNYRGKLIDGTEFDSSYSRGEPSTFRVGSLISGWVEGLQLMPVGSKYRFVIPPQLGYGAYGAGSIPPYSVLIFEVELLEIL